MSGKHDDEETRPSWTFIDFDELEVGSIIGGGGVGVIYRGRFRQTDVAVKTFFDPRRVNESVRRDFLDELMVMSRLKHSNIVELIGACTEPNLFFVMELCEASLFQILHVEREKLTEKECFQVCIDIGCAMEYLHSLTPVVIHRDLKSHNILRTFSGSFKLCDFGQVKVKTTAAGILKTPIYMAPELFLSKSYNKSVDVYSFGMVVWEAFTQEIPFYLLEVSDIRERVIAGERPRLNSYAFPSGVAAIIKACWSQEADDRPAFPDIVDDLIAINDRAQESKHVDMVKTTGDALDGLLLK